jgi:hypothetical protein
MTSAVRASCGLYKMLLFAYPSDFRLRFGSEMVTTFSDLCRVGTERSAGSRSIVAVRTREVFSAAVPLHLQSPIVVATSLSLLSSLALFMMVFYAMSHVCSK